MIVPGWLRRLRLRMLMERQLDNGRAVWEAYSRGGTPPILRFRNGLVLEHRPEDSAAFLFLEIFANACYRRGGIRVPPRGLVADVGANIGAFTLECASRHPSVRIHAYEPDPATFEVLQRNVRVNHLEDRVVLWNEAVAGGSATLNLWHGDGSIAASAYLPTDQRRQPTRVPAVPLRTVVERGGGHIAWLKLDVEGAEADIFEGGRDVLASIDAITAEYHPRLVVDVVSRLHRALTPTFTVAFTCGGRCGPMMYATRAPEKP